MNEFDLERMLARSQLFLSVIFIFGYFGLLGAAALKWIDGSYVKELTPIVGIIVFFWFNRQRPRSAADQNDASGGAAASAKNPTRPPSAA